MNRFGWVLAGLLLLILLAVATLVHSPPPPAPTPVAAPKQQSALVVPVAGVRVADLHDTWGAPRGGGSRVHHALDIMAARGTPVVAAAPGRIEKIFESAAGGHTLYIRSADGGTVFYYAHLDGYALGLVEGMAVARGERIASVGSTGDADPSAPHLHFEIKRLAPGERWWEGTDVDPYPLLVAMGSPR